MRKQAMLSSVKDSVLAAIIAGIGIFIIESYGNSKDPGWYDASGILLLIVGLTLTVNLLAALGASALIGDSYHANKSKYAIRHAVFNDDKYSGIFHSLKVMFFYVIGVFIYPLAVIITLFSLKELFVRDESYEQATDEQQTKQRMQDALDPTVKTSDKKWKVNNGVLGNYYFHTKKEAYEFVISNDIDAKPQETFF